MILITNPRAQKIIKTLRDAGLSDLQINNAFFVLDNGGSVNDALAAIDALPTPVRANFEFDLLFAEVERRMQSLELVERNSNADVYPDGAIAWPSNY